MKPPDIAEPIARIKVDLRVPSKGLKAMCVKTYCADRNAPEQPALALPAGVPDTQTGKSLQPKGSLVCTCSHVFRT